MPWYDIGMPPSDFPALETRASFLLSQLGMQSAQRFTAALAPLGITPNRFGVLAQLAREEGRTQQELANALGLHRNTVSTRVARAQELLGLDLGDPETRLAVHLACRALRPRPNGA